MVSESDKMERSDITEIKHELMEISRLVSKIKTQLRSKNSDPRVIEKLVIDVNMSTSNIISVVEPY